jgi:hypothetical protein
MAEWRHRRKLMTYCGRIDYAAESMHGSRVGSVRAVVYPLIEVM